MTKQDVINFIEGLLIPGLVNTITMIKEALYKILDFITESAVTEIPDWANDIEFNTDGSGDGKYCFFLDSADKKRIFETKVDNNINHEPPSDPGITENDYWKEVSQGAGSAIKGYEADALYGTGLIIVHHDHSIDGDGLYKLNEPTRPFFSTDIETEILAGKWIRMGGSGSGASVAETYDDIADLLADQADQKKDFFYFVIDASADATVDAGWALYQKLEASTGAIGDYRKLAENESLDVIFSNADASETVAGKVEEGTDAELQSGTATGGTGARLFVNPSKLATWLTWVKSQAQTFSIFTATVFKIGGQAASAGTYRVLYIDDTGQVFKEQNFGVDPTNKRWLLKAVNNLSSGYTLQIVDSSDTPILKVYNDGTTEFGGTSAFLTVPSTIPDGSAGIIVRNAIDIAYRLKDEGSFDYLKIKSTTTGIGKALYINQNVVNDYGKGFQTIRKQAKITTSATAAAQNIVESIAIPSGYAIQLRVHDAIAFATNGNVQTCSPFTCLAYNNAGTTSGVPPTITALRITAADGNFNINYNDGTDELEIRFQNESGTGRTYDVMIDYSYILTPIPV
jgi:hypothetical protein